MAPPHDDQRDVTIRVPEEIADALDGCEFGVAVSGQGVRELLRAAISETAITPASILEQDPYAEEAELMATAGVRLTRLGDAYSRYAVAVGV